jgi:hypothetical protein
MTTILGLTGTLGSAAKADPMRAKIIKLIGFMVLIPGLVKAYWAALHPMLAYKFG